MIRLSTFCLLLAVATAQNGYEYNKPGRPFQGQNRPGFPSGPTGGFPGSTTPFSDGAQNDEYSTPGSGAPGAGAPGSGAPGTSGYPSGANQGYPGSNGRPQGYPGQSPSFTGQGPSGPTAAYPSGPYPGAGQTDSTGFGPVGPGGSDDTGAYEGGDYSAIPGEPDKDYPILTEIPETSFRCDAQAYPGYYADVETRCQVFHVCSNNRTYDFLCPNGTIFSQQVFVCVWWNQFDCETAPSLYELNANLYDYSITGARPEGGLPDTGVNDFVQGEGYPGNTGQQGPSSGYPGASGQGPSSNYPGSSGPQGPSGSYGTPPTGQQGPSGSYGTPSTGSQGPSGSYGTPSTGNQGPSGSYGTPSAGPQGPSGSYGSPNAGSQGPSPSYGAPSTGLQGPSPTYGGPSGTPQEPTSQGGYPGSRPGGSQGYPSGRPSGPSFPTGNGRPNGSSQNGFNSQKPNRQYLPPRN